MQQPMTVNRPEPKVVDLPFRLKDVKEAIPPHCFESSAIRSLAYFFGIFL
ncbi:omega-3 fatty acid desaturase [Crocosphaera watsonii WH 8502]|uniref:Omega-3 fatty acid desaturase n=1 Tax=Crocosphaera watsonii WH 8502 TaxID=423474 RepID=T2I9R9_CROWT|nr:omega-3 fatty acid desaturase [Crocosphaera watsonii]CCQ49577.1 omega-3 fatty acid desaturase [Crocosphaera watsonii WH 8502]